MIYYEYCGIRKFKKININLNYDFKIWIIKHQSQILKLAVLLWIHLTTNSI